MVAIRCTREVSTWWVWMCHRESQQQKAEVVVVVTNERLRLVMKKAVIMRYT